MFGTIFSFFCFLLFMLITVFSIGYVILSPYFGYVLYKKVIIVYKHISKILAKEKIFGGMLQNFYCIAARQVLFLCVVLLFFRLVYC